MTAPIVLVPGLLCSTEVWAPQLPALWEHGPVHIARTTDGDTISAVAGSILAAAPPRFALAGISMGGYVCFEILRQAPERVRRLALLDTSALADNPEQSAGRRALVEQLRRGDFTALTEVALTELLHPVHRDDPALRAVNRRMAAAVGLEGFARQTEAVISRPDSRPLLPTVHVPTTVLVGDTDTVTPPEQSELIAAGIAGARLVVVEECGHASTLERPAAVTAALTHWLES